MTQEEKDALELRKVKALEKIANSVDALTIWFEEIDKEDWDKRLQFYLSEWHKKLVLVKVSLYADQMHKNCYRLDEVKLI